MTRQVFHIETAAPLRHPLVPVAAAFLLGVAVARWVHVPAMAIVMAAVAMWVLWLAAEIFRSPRAALIFLGATIVLGGAGAWTLNQESVEPAHIVRFTREDEELPVTFRAVVLVPPDVDGDSRGTPRWVARLDEVLTDRGWLPATGDVVVASRGAALHAGERAEIYGWLSRIPGPANPGAMDQRAMLAADRIFAQVRVPRESGVMLLTTNSAGENWLVRLRRTLRGKLLENIVLEDVPAAYTLTALLLGYRDPVINSVSQAFSNAGVAHLLAISGSHVVFFTALVWAVLRFVPLRPRVRELVIAAIVGAYILATPCGPPIVRASIALVLVLLARLSGRPAQHFNTLAAAAIIVVLLRPADIASAGFQLSFVATAGLILFAPRLYHFLFDRWIERQTLIAELSQSRWARRKLVAVQWVGGLVVANIIGATTAAPLVAFHFGQVNLWAVLAGLVALPFVMLAMVAAVLQLAAGALWSGLGAALSPVTSIVGHGLIIAVKALAALPGAALAVRAPPVWIVVLLYAALVVWALRKRVGLSRAMALNGCVASMAIAAAWVAWTIPVGHLNVTVLDAGLASSMVIRAPDGTLWALNTGTVRGASADALFAPALRLAGERQLAGIVVAALDENHGAGAADLIETAHPGAVYLSAAAWSRRHETLAGAGVDRTTAAARIAVHPLVAGNAIDLGGGARLDVLWPPAENIPPAAVRRDLILLASFAEQRILIVDPAAASALIQVLHATPTLHCEAIVFTGAQRGTADESLRQLVAPLQAKWLVWTGRTVWAGRRDPVNEFNTRDGAIGIDFDVGNVRVGRR